LVPRRVSSRSIAPCGLASPPLPGRNGRLGRRTPRGGRPQRALRCRAGRAWSSTPTPTASCG
jgi:hypothetical protein